MINFAKKKMQEAKVGAKKAVIKGIVKDAIGDVNSEEVGKVLDEYAKITVAPLQAIPKGIEVVQAHKDGIANFVADAFTLWSEIKVSIEDAKSELSKEREDGNKTAKDCVSKIGEDMQNALRGLGIVKSSSDLVEEIYKKEFKGLDLSDQNEAKFMNKIADGIQKLKEEAKAEVVETAKGAEITKIDGITEANDGKEVYAVYDGIEYYTTHLGRLISIYLEGSLVFRSLIQLNAMELDKNLTANVDLTDKVAPCIEFEGEEYFVNEVAMKAYNESVKILETHELDEAQKGLLDVVIKLCLKGARKVELNNS